MMSVKIHFSTFDEAVRFVESRKNDYIIMVDVDLNSSFMKKSKQLEVFLEKLSGWRWGISDTAWANTPDDILLQSDSDYLSTLADFGMKFYQPTTNLPWIHDNMPSVLDRLKRSKVYLIGQQKLVDQDDWRGLLSAQLEEEAEFVLAHDVYIYQKLETFINRLAGDEDETLYFHEIVELASEFPMFIGGELDMNSIGEICSYRDSFYGFSLLVGNMTSTKALGGFSPPTRLNGEELEDCLGCLASFQ